MKLLHKGLALWLSVWILCPGAPHHLVSLLLDVHHDHSSHSDRFHALTAGEHAHFQIENDGGHTILDHSEDPGIVRLSNISVVVPVCPVDLISATHLILLPDGILSSTALTLLVLPALYQMFYRADEKRAQL